MNLTLSRRRTPINGDIARMRNEFDRTFNRFMIDPWTMIDPASLPAQDWFPPVDMSETEKEFLIRAEVPGLDVDKLDINVMGTTLTISGQKEQRSENMDEDFYQSECRFGAFKRSIELPDTIDPDKVTADYENGVVIVHIGKKPGTKPRHIAVKQSGKKVNVAK